MSKRKAPKEKDGFYRFIFSMYQYYLNRGLMDVPSKVRMTFDVFDVLVRFMKKVDSGKDHILVSALKGVRKMVSSRGLELSNALRSETDDERIKQYRQALQDLHNMRDALDVFIKNYRGEPHDHNE